MAERIEVQNLTCQASVTPANPTEVALTGVVACQVRRVAIRIAAGHAGLTGIALGYGHLAVIPRTAGRYISGDSEVLIYDLDNYEPGPQWQAFLINQDTQPHVWQVRFEVDELRLAPGATPPQPIDPTQIYAAAGELVGAA